MCLLVLAWNVHPRYRLVLAANRDEFHDRPAAPLGWWQDAKGIVAGRDLRGSGTWMGAARSGRFGVVTNFRDLEPPPTPDAPSRGELVPGFLADTTSPQRYLDELRGHAARYAGFNLLVGDADALHYYANRNGVTSTQLTPGVYGLSNHLLDSPWPKVLRTRERLGGLARRDALEADRLFELLDQCVIPLYAIRARRRGYEVSAMKAMMDMAGLNGGPVRPPLVSVSAQEEDELRAILASWDKFL